MRLKVIDDPTPTPAAAPWYSPGLRFTCTQCGNCCTGGPGYVWISDVEIQRLAEFLKKPAAEVIRKYCRTINGKLSLKENKRSESQYDCIFLKEIAGPDGKAKRICEVYSVRPLQCRTWPFWDGLLSSRAAWDQASRGCPGMDHGKKYSVEQIEALRDAKDWPDAK